MNDQETNDTTLVVEEYILMIHAISLSQNTPLKAITLSEKMRSSPSTVHSTLMRMQRDDYVRIGSKKEITLTEKGIQKSKELYHRHRLIEVFLYEKLEIPWDEIHEHAHKLEHALTPLVQERLNKFMGYPQCCPHGSPMPDSAIYEGLELITLEKTKKGDTVKILMVDEIVEENKEMMSFLYQKQLIPNTKHRILENETMIKTVTLHNDADEQVSLPYDIATLITATLIA